MRNASADDAAGHDGRSAGSGGPPETPRVVQRLALAVLGIFAVLAIVLARVDVISLKLVGLNYHALTHYIGLHPLVSLASFAAIYVVAAALALPCGLVMTVTGGLLFGWAKGALAAACGATIGATMLFLMVKASLGGALARRAGPFVARLGAGFRENALSYLLFLRLVPFFPFTIVNVVPALLGVPLSTFLVGTAIGILPGTIAFALAGAGLGNAIEAQNAAYNACLARLAANTNEGCQYSIDLSKIASPELIWAGVAIGLVALLPVAVKRWSKRNAAA